ncbi:MAG: hypothetical protein M5R40_17375 [Anaerolineae bacterium]|nr:hypothetical protein [Anaerolineae bacterium]
MQADVTRERAAHDIEVMRRGRPLPDDAPFVAIDIRRQFNVLPVVRCAQEETAHVHPKALKHALIGQGHAEVARRSASAKGLDGIRQSEMRGQALVRRQADARVPRRAQIDRDAIGRLMVEGALKAFTRLHRGGPCVRSQKLRMCLDTGLIPL